LTAENFLDLFKITMHALFPKFQGLSARNSSLLETLPPVVEIFYSLSINS